MAHRASAHHCTMTSLTAIIVDDEPLAREGIRQLLKSERDIHIIAECGDGLQARRQILEHHPRLLFLDIQMPGLDGLGLIGSLPRPQRPEVIFVTAFDRYAIDAFTVHAVDYLLKPVDPARFNEALQRVRERLSSDRQHPQPENAGDNILALLNDIAAHRNLPERILIRSTGKISFVDVADIQYIEAAGDYVCIHTRGERHMLHETLQELATRLDPVKFVRVHRSTIISTHAIKEMQPLFRGDYAIILRDGTKLAMSRKYRDQALAVLGHQK